MVLADKFLNILIFLKEDILNRMTRDEPVLAYHYRKMHSRILGYRKCLDEVVICLLIVLGIYLYPSGIPRTHTVGMVAVDVYRTRQRSVHKCEHERKSV